MHDEGGNIDNVFTQADSGGVHIVDGLFKLPITEISKAFGGICAHEMPFRI